MKNIISTIEELRATVRINASVPWETAAPFLETARDIYLVRYLGEELVTQMESDTPEERFTSVIRLARKVLGPLAMWLGNSELSVRISDSGFTVERNDKFAPASEDKIAKVQESLERRGFQYLDVLLEYLEIHADEFPEWKNSRYFTLRGGNYIRSARQFQECGVDIAYSRLTFEQLRGLMTLIEERYIRELLGDDLHVRLRQTADTTSVPAELTLLGYIRAFIAVKTAELTTSEKSKQNRETEKYTQKEFRPLIRPVWADAAGNTNFFAEQADGYLAKIQQTLTKFAPELGLTASPGIVELKKDDFSLFFSDASYTS